MAGTATNFTRLGGTLVWSVRLMVVAVLLWAAASGRAAADPPPMGWSRTEDGQTFTMYTGNVAYYSTDDEAWHRKVMYLPTQPFSQASPYKIQWHFLCPKPEYNANITARHAYFTIEWRYWNVGIGPDDPDAHFWLETRIYWTQNPTVGPAEQLIHTQQGPGWPNVLDNALGDIPTAGFGHAPDLNHYGTWQFEYWYGVNGGSGPIQTEQYANRKLSFTEARSFPRMYFVDGGGQVHWEATVETLPRAPDPGAWAPTNPRWTARVTDASGMVVRLLQGGMQPSDQMPLDIFWDGKNDLGYPVPPGVYYLEVTVETDYQGDGVDNPDKRRHRVLNDQAIGAAGCNVGGVNLLSGNFFYSSADLSIPTRGLPLTFTRSYNSLRADEEAMEMVVESGYPQVETWHGDPWKIWMTTADLRVQEIEDQPGGGKSVICYRLGGGEDHFQDMQGAYVPSRPDITSHLTRDGNGFSLRLKDGTTCYYGPLDPETGYARLSGITDTNGNTNQLIYDADGRLIELWDPAGRRVTVTWTPGEPETRRPYVVADWAGRQWWYMWDLQHPTTSGRLNNVYHPIGPFYSNSYFQYGTGIRLSGFNERVKQLELYLTWSTAGRATSVVNALGQPTTFAYSAPPPPLTATVAFAGASHAFELDVRGNVTKYTDPLGGITTTAYNIANRPTTVTDPLGHTTAMIWDAAGNLASTTDANGATTTMTYDPVYNQLTSISSPLGHTTTISYDGAGNPTQFRDPNNAVTSLSSGAFGLLSQVSDPTGVTTTISYDGYGYPQSAICNGEVTTLVADSLGRLTQETDPGGHVTTRTFDAQSRLTQMTQPSNATWSFSYDPVTHDLTSVTDPQRTLKSYAFDGLHRLTGVTEPLTGTTYTYDAASNLKTVTDGRGKVTTYNYDPLGRLTSTLDPLGRVTTTTYNEDSLPVARTDASSNTAALSYDPAHRLIIDSYSDGGSHTYTYNRDDQVASVTDVFGSIGYGYDNAGRVININFYNARQFQYVYDPGGRLLQFTDATGVPTQYTYDPSSGRLASTTRDQQTTTYGYNSEGLPTTQMFPNGVQIALSYDAGHRLTAQDVLHGATPLSSTTHGYNPVDLRTSTVETFPSEGGGTETETFAYTYKSGPYWLADTTWNGTTIEQNQYDSAGNRTQRVAQEEGAPPETTTFVYDDANQLTQAGGVAFGYDLAGNVITRSDALGTTGFAWNAEGQLKQVNLPSGMVHQYRYDANGLLARQERTAGGVSTVSRVLWDGWNSINKFDEALAQLKSSNVLGLGGPERALSPSTGGHILVKDSLGSTRLLVDNLGELANFYAYDNWGSPVASLPGAQANTDLRYTGHLFEPWEPNVYDPPYLHYARARWYLSDEGRFASRDPLPGRLGSSDSLNGYQYSFNDPINYVDANGCEAGLKYNPYGITTTPIEAPGADLERGIDTVKWVVATVAAIKTGQAWRSWFYQNPAAATNAANQVIEAVGAPPGAPSVASAGRVVLGPGASGMNSFVRRIVNSEMAHAAERAVLRAGFKDVKEAREALKVFGREIELKGQFPADAIADQAHADRVIVPGFGEGGAVVYQITKEGTYRLKTVLVWRP